MSGWRQKDGRGFNDFCRKLKTRTLVVGNNYEISRQPTNNLLIAINAEMRLKVK